MASTSNYERLIEDEERGVLSARLGVGRLGRTGSAELETRGNRPVGGKWQRAMKSVLDAQRTVKSFPGCVPGVDVKRTKHSHLCEKYNCESVVTVIDYDHEQFINHDDLNKRNLIEFLSRPRPSWSKVRWINVQGLSWDVVEELALFYDLHPLAVEDLVHLPQRIKTDIYDNHVFVSAMVVSLGRSSGSSCEEVGRLISSRKPWSREEREAKPHLDIEIFCEQVSLFLFKDGTVLSIFQKEGELVTRPLMAQLHECKTLARDSEDASFLLNLLLDGVVDHALMVVESYTLRLEAFERKVLQDKPQSAYTKELFLLQGDLKLLRRTLTPTYYMITTLKKIDQLEEAFLTPLTQTYLDDILDHCSTLTENIDTLCAEAKDLIDLIFNTISHDTNQQLQALSIVSTIFLPLSFVAGVYGTNFEFLPEIHWKYGYAYFWGLCLLITCVFVLILRRYGMTSPD